MFFRHETFNEIQRERNDIFRYRQTLSKFLEIDTFDERIFKEMQKISKITAPLPREITRSKTEQTFSLMNYELDGIKHGQENVFNLGSPINSTLKETFDTCLRFNIKRTDVNRLGTSRHVR